jgi:hypothetical protein
MEQRAITERLAEYLRTQAEFRGAKAEQHPDDPRNENAMRALYALADWVERRSPDEAPFATLALQQAPYGDTLWLSEAGRLLVNGFGFRAEKQPPTKREFKALLDDLIAVEIEASTEDVEDEVASERPADAG